MEEIWKDIKGYEGYYQVSNLGRVKSNGNRSNHKTEKLLSLNKNSKGYLRVMLYRECKYKSFFVHRLVAEHFIPNPLNLPQVNHLDCDKTNNCVSNLEWCTNRENTIHSYRMRGVIR